MIPPDSNRPDFDERLEAFLDGTLSGAEAAAFAASLRADGELAKQAELQSHIGERLGQLFGVEIPPQQRLLALLTQAPPNPTILNGFPPRSRDADAPGRRKAVYWVAAGLAAATVALAFAFPGGERPAAEEPHFVARRLDDIYRDAVASGFEPSYECHEPARFAAAFQQRQDVPLRLLPMPSGVRMLGLAYAGGMSRSTTSMLCYVDGSPVMVFVDRVANDRPAIAASPADRLQIFRSERHGLVFYEVTPLPEPRVAALMAPAAPALQ